MPSSPSPSPAAGELAAPDPNLRFPAEDGLIVGDDGVVAPTLTQLVTWNAKGKVVATRALADVGIDDITVQAWDLRDAIFVVGGGREYSWAAAGFEPWTAKGLGKVEHASPRPSGSTTPRKKYRWPSDVTTNGSHIAASFVDGRVRVFEVTGRQVGEFQPIGLAADAGTKRLGVQYLPNDDLLVSGRDVECPVQAWRSDGSALVRQFDRGPTRPVHVTLSPDDAMLLVTTFDRKSGKMPWWAVDTSTFEERHRGELPTAASAVALSPGGDLIAGAAGPNAAPPLQVTVVSIADGSSHSFRRDGYVAQSMAFSTDGKVLYTHNGYMGIIAWDARSGKELRRFDMP